MGSADPRAVDGYRGHGGAVLTTGLWLLAAVIVITWIVLTIRDLRRSR